MDELKQVLMKYIKLAESSINDIDVNKSVKDLKVLYNKTIVLREIVNRLEESRAFEDLSAKTKELLEKTLLFRYCQNIHAVEFGILSEKEFKEEVYQVTSDSGFGLGECMKLVIGGYINRDNMMSINYYAMKGRNILLLISNFFKRSGIYIDIFENKEFDKDLLFIKYCQEFSPKINKYSVFASLNDVKFAKSTLDLGSFKIVKYSKEEIENILENRINNYFYPDAVVNSKKIQNKWLISFTTKEDLSPKYGIPETIEDHFINYPVILSDILQEVSLFNWGFIDNISIEDDSLGDPYYLRSYFTVDITHVITKINSLLFAPFESKEYYYSEKDDHDMPDFGDDYVGYFWKLDNKKTNEFEKLLNDMNDAYHI